jgi:hypothetical protein
MRDYTKIAVRQGGTKDAGKVTQLQRMKIDVF